MSAYYYSLGGDNSLISRGILPGALFITVIVALLLLIIGKVNLRRLAAYVGKLYIIYLIVYYITMFSGSVAFIIDPITTGYGAFATFGLTNKHIAKINYRPFVVFILGAAAFFANEIFLFHALQEYISPYYNIEANLTTMFAGAFLPWQLIVGTALWSSILKSGDNVSNPKSDDVSIRV